MAKSEPLHSRGFGKTSRRDRWWTQSLATFGTLVVFIVYATWAGLQNAHYHVGNYLSPLYAPEIYGSSPHALFGPQPQWWPSWIPFSPALFILPIPFLFRFTCYFFRGAYYKAVWADPPACAVSEPRKGYTGENGLPLILQNLHRYALYLAILLLCFVWYDAVKAFNFDGRFGIGVGTLVLLIDAVLISLYTFSCHSLRHLIGGRLNCLSKHPVRKACYSCVSGWNTRHMVWAWVSMGFAMFSDMYVRMLSMGMISDWRII